MIRTGIPYGPEIMQQVYEEGAIVDLSRVRFPTCVTQQEQMHSLFVYLRNTGFNVQFDFTEMDYHQKVTLLKEYLDTNITYDIPELTSTWLCILYACLGERVKGMTSILNDLELVTMQADEFEYIKKIWTFIISLPLYLIKRLNVDGVYSTAEKTEEDFNLVNFYRILESPELDDLINKGAGGIPPKDYVKIFTVENTKLFESLKNCSFTTFMQGITSASDKEFQEFINDLYMQQVDFLEGI